MNTALVVVAVLVAAHALLDATRAWRRGATARREDRDRGAVVAPALPPVSIIVPVWNDADVIEAALAALANETRSRAVTVRVVAGGDDGSFRSARAAFARHGLRGEVLPQGPGGKNAALNRALARTSEDVVVFVDADTLVERGWLSALIAPIARGDAEATSGHFAPRHRSSVSAIFEIDQFVSQRLRQENNLFGGATIAVARQALDTLGGRLPEEVVVGVDWDLRGRLTEAGLRCRYVPEARVRTHIPSTWRSQMRNEVRWRRAHLVLERSRALRGGSRRQLTFAYIPLVHGLLAFGWAVGPLTAWALGAGARAGLVAWCLFVTWVLLRQAARPLAAHAYAHEARFLRVLPAYLGGFVVAAYATWFAAVTARALHPHFKGPRPRDAALAKRPDGRTGVDGLQR